MGDLGIVDSGWSLSGFGYDDIMSDISDLVQFAVAMSSRIVSVNILQEPSYYVEYLIGYP